MTPDEFSLYVAVDADVQVTNEELCAGQQAAGGVDTNSVMSSEAKREADDSRQQPSRPFTGHAVQRTAVSGYSMCKQGDG